MNKLLFALFCSSVKVALLALLFLVGCSQQSVSSDKSSVPASSQAAQQVEQAEPDYEAVRLKEVPSVVVIYTVNSANRYEIRSDQWEWDWQVGATIDLRNGNEVFFPVQSITMIQRPRGW